MIDMLDEASNVTVSAKVDSFGDYESQLMTRQDMLQAMRRCIMVKQLVVDMAVQKTRILPSEEC
jgi:hypothetical protein